MRVDDPPLPRLEHDRPVVLAARAVLGERLDPTLARRHDVHALSPRHPMAGDVPAEIGRAHRFCGGLVRTESAHPTR
jgi:hypothetical protein